VDGCETRCWSKSDRYKHLVSDHKYPSTFDFDSSQQRRKSRVKSNGGTRNRSRSSSSASDSMIMHIAHEAENVSGNVASIENKRTEAKIDNVNQTSVSQQTLDNKTHPHAVKKVECRHFANGYCKLGDNCNFKHSGDTSKVHDNGTGGNNMHVDDDFLDGFNKSLKFAVPRSVAFGRKAKAAFEKPAK
jgi:hypothetical protein